MVVDVLVMLAAAGGVLAFVLRPLFRPTKDTRDDVEDAALLASRQAVLRSLGDLDLDYQLGRVDEEDYLRFRQAGRREGAEILRAIEQSDGLPQAESLSGEEGASIDRQGITPQETEDSTSVGGADSRGRGRKGSRRAEARGRAARAPKAEGWRQFAVVALLSAATLCLLATIALVYVTENRGNANGAAASPSGASATAQSLGAIGTGPGVISGRVTNGTTKADLSQGTDVFLLVRVNGSLVDQRDATLDSNGSYQFADLPVGGDQTYEVVVTYGGAPYTSSPLTLAKSEPRQSADLQVYEATSVDPGLKATQVAMLFGAPDAQQQAVRVYEFLTIVNPSDRAFVPDPSAVAGPQNILRFGLPTDARDIALGDGFDLSQAIQVGRGFGTFAPVPPGEHLYTFSFLVPYQAGRLSIDPPIVYGAESLQIAVPESGLALSSPDLGSAEPVTLSGSAFWLLTGEHLEAGAQPTIELAGLPAKPLLNQVLDVVRLPAVVPLLLMLGLSVGVALAGIRQARLDGRPTSAPAPQALGGQVVSGSTALAHSSPRARPLRLLRSHDRRPTEVGEAESG